MAANGCQAMEQQMPDIEFSAGADVEFGEAYEAGGEALDYAAGADAVDAALGAVKRGLRRRGYVNAGAQKAAGMFTYFVNLPTNAATYIGGAAGTGQATCNTPYQIIDIVVVCAATSFRLSSFFVGDTNMWLGAGAIAADLFFVAVQNRFVRFTTVQRGQTVQVGFSNILAATTPLTIELDLKVRSYRRS